MIPSPGEGETEMRRVSRRVLVGIAACVAALAVSAPAVSGLGGTVHGSLQLVNAKSVFLVVVRVQQEVCANAVNRTIIDVKPNQKIDISFESLFNFDTCQAPGSHKLMYAVEAYTKGGTLVASGFLEMRDPYKRDTYVVKAQQDQNYQRRFLLSSLEGGHRTVSFQLREYEK